MAALAMSLAEVLQRDALADQVTCLAMKAESLCQLGDRIIWPTEIGVDPAKVVQRVPVAISTDPLPHVSCLLETLRRLVQPPEIQVYLSEVDKADAEKGRVVEFLE